MSIWHEFYCGRINPSDAIWGTDDDPDDEFTSYQECHESLLALLNIEQAEILDELLNL